MTTHQKGRRQRAYLGTLHLNLLHFTNPWVTVAWAWFMPGFGHLLLGQYILGWILFVWEVVLNVQTQFNVAIIYTFIGRFDEAVQILKQEDGYWLLTYGAVFVFTVYSTYKIAVDNNLLYELAHKDNAPISIFKIDQIQWNSLSKRSPIVGALWSLFIPGIGAVYTHRVLTAIFEVVWWNVILMKSHLLSSIQYTLTGKFDKAVSVLDPEWALFVPSMISFTAYFTYVITVERNKLFDKEQSNYLSQNYQRNKRFPLRIKDDPIKMRFIASFNHSEHLEKAITALESLGVMQEDIFAAPLDKRNEKSQWFDTIHRSDGKSLFDGIMLLGALGTFFGTVYGFILHWGPVVWGVAGFIAGCLLGCIIKGIPILLTAKKREKVPKTEVVLIVDCENDLARKTEEVLWSNHAFGLSQIRN
ncbi:hypothetical protein PH210_23580 [Paenibacillus sp. BSR1-1]|uniref:hypothetical protein n=1 Tax=Paenibacillus sp. BSR1-1 TaxID=3020845 RepID=UPI0025B1665A|nr:hypothetical protein [Paenibacillus sp. BSR1-1]MDN3019158.1 hypothetical protein [Paenibacillus sp. BSR1-1]